MRSAPLLTFALALLLGGAAPATAQITIDAGDWPRPTTYLDSSYFTALYFLEDNFAEPGEGVTWDYVNKDTFGAVLRVDSYSAADEANFPGATFKRTYFNEPFLGFEVRTEEFRGISDEHYKIFGERLYDTTYALTGAGNGPNDAIRFVGGDYPLLGDALVPVIFPLTYGTAWETDYEEVVPFELTFAAAGLNAVPGRYRRIFDERREVVGYGTLKLPGIRGRDSVAYDALMVDIRRVVTDSFFLGGAPAPQQLLDGFDLEQGDTFHINVHAFYALTDLAVPLMVYSVGRLPVTFRFPGGGRVSDLRRALPPAAAVFPNPAAPAGEVGFVLAEALPRGGRVEVVALDGRRVLAQAVPTGTTAFGLALPADLARGQYFYTVHADGAGLVAGGTLQVQ